MKINKFLFILIGLLVLILVGYGIFLHTANMAEIEEQNICTNDELVAQLITGNSNPFSKFKFIKKRNNDCKALLISHENDALDHKNNGFCPILDASTNSITLLIYTYVNDMYDRETASKELKSLFPLMAPYDYCPQYSKDMTTLVKIKKRFGL